MERVPAGARAGAGRGLRHRRHLAPPRQAPRTQLPGPGHHPIPEPGQARHRAREGAGRPQRLVSGYERARHGLSGRHLRPGVGVRVRRAHAGQEEVRRGDDSRAQARGYHRHRHLVPARDPARVYRGGEGEPQVSVRGVGAPVLCLHRGVRSADGGHRQDGDGGQRQLGEEHDQELEALHLGRRLGPVARGVQGTEDLVQDDSRDCDAREDAPRVRLRSHDVRHDEGEEEARGDGQRGVGYRRRREREMRGGGSHAT
mmetsp:Transcript_5990/g.26492  ORF Transcript_5990/g.26492 Transcript_5990/m.26492 type:complete len:257 (+) Transcript_5990:597-1367(+)